MRNSINFIYIFKEGDGDEDYEQNEQNAGATGGASDYSTPKTQPSPKKNDSPTNRPSSSSTKKPQEEENRSSVYYEDQSSSKNCKLKSIKHYL